MSSTPAELNINAMLFWGGASRSLGTRNLPISEDRSGLSVNSFDNRGKSADFLSEFRSSLEKFQKRLTTNSFFSDSFSHNIKTARVSDSDKALASASRATEKKYFSIGIERLAGSRTAVSSRFVSNEVTEFEAGTYSFDLAVNGTSYSLDVEIEKKVSDPDTNLDVLRKVQSAIHFADNNVEAFVSEGKRKDYNPYAENVYERVSFLTVRNKSTGDILYSSCQ